MPTPGPRPHSEALLGFAAEVGPDGPVRAEGGGTRADVGGRPSPDARVVTAPTGIVEVRAEELVVTVGAGTPVQELEDELRAIGQLTGLPGPRGATVGGALAVGRSSVHSRRFGPLRDVLLGASAVDADGRAVRAGGATVKNVSGFDLCRLWVGSLGTLALLGEVTLRTRPTPAASLWLSGGGDPGEADRSPAATAVLHDGQTTWVHLAGHPDDVRSERARLGRCGIGEECEAAPALPPHRRSVDPATLGVSVPTAGRWVAEWGVGIVHTEHPMEPSAVPAGVVRLNRAVKARMDRHGRLNPGRDPLVAAGVAPGREA